MYKTWLRLTFHSCKITDVKEKKQQSKAVKFLSLKDIIEWYERAPENYRTQIQSYVKDPDNRVFVVDDMCDTLQSHPLIFVKWDRPPRGTFSGMLMLPIAIGQLE